MIEVVHVSKIYRSKGGSPDVKAVDDVSLRFADHGLVFILGRSGSGKSTLLHLLGGLDGVSSGDIIVDGVSISSLPKGGLDSYRNSAVGFLFQDYCLLEDRSVDENVAFPLSLQGKKDTATIRKSLAKVGMAGYAKRRCISLSGGEKQRVALARALVKDPKIILADEPTGALDSYNGEVVMCLLKELSKERLVVIVSHDRKLASSFGDRIIEIVDGRIVSDTQKELEEGDVKELELKKSRLGFKSALQFAFRSLRLKKWRLLVSLLLSSVAFSLFGFAFAVSDIDLSRAVSSSLSTGDRDQVFIHPNYTRPYLYGDIRDGMAARAKNEVFYKEVYRFPYEERVKVTRKGEENEHVKATPFTKVYDIDRVNSCAYLEDLDLAKSGFTLEGRLPERSDEVVISKLLFDSLSRSVGLSTYQGLQIDAGSAGVRWVVGVIDTYFNVEKYESFRKRDLERDEGLKTRLEGDLEANFATTIFIPKEEYETKYGNLRAEISLVVRKDGFYTDVSRCKIEDVASSLEGIYQDYRYNVNREYDLEHPDFDIDRLSGALHVSEQWFVDNGYAYDRSSKSYSKTLSDEGGEYVVTYAFDYDRLVYLRTSERDDPRVLEAEKIDLTYLSRREFLSESFLFPEGSDQSDFLLDDEHFREIEDDEVIVGLPFDDPYSEIPDPKSIFTDEMTTLSFRNNSDSIDISKVTAVFNSFMDPLGDYNLRSLAVSPKNYDYLLSKSEVFCGLKARLSGNAMIDEEFLAYFVSMSPDYIRNYVTEAIWDVQKYSIYPWSAILAAAIIFLAVLSSLIIMNFISLSLSYGKKERGILFALGARDKDVLSLYALEATLIAIIDGILSSFGSFAACLLANLFISVRSAMHLQVVFLPFYVPLVIFALTVSSCLISSIVPILMNGRVKPIEILKAE